ncbi:MAG: hypothetical protein IKJ78_02085 [Bacteroidales bacterium]|nr:hypothetical protein [Bacteroidales bacterium]
MEHIKTIDEYIAAEMGGKIVRKRNSPMAHIAVLAIGVVLLVLLHSTHAADSVQAMMLTAGIICLVVGLVLTAMNLSGAMWHYKYIATGSRMKEYKVYLSPEDYRVAYDALTTGATGDLATVKPVVSSNSALRVLHSKDGSIALVQGGRYDTGHFEAETPVKVLVGTEVAAIEALCR